MPWKTLLVPILLLTSVTSIAPAETHDGSDTTCQITGQVFVVTRGGDSVKLGLVRVSVLAEATIKSSINGTARRGPSERADFRARARKLSAEIDTLGSHGQDAQPQQTELSRLLDAVADVGSPGYYFDALPAGIYATKTDADGKFAIRLPRTGRCAVVARATREVGGDMEVYYWMVWASCASLPEQLLLSNDNMLGGQCEIASRCHGSSSAVFQVRRTVRRFLGQARRIGYEGLARFYNARFTKVPGSHSHRRPLRPGNRLGRHPPPLG